MKNKNIWNDIKNVVKVTKDSLTKKEVLLKLNLKVNSGNYRTFDKYIKINSIDILHFNSNLVRAKKLINYQRIIMPNEFFFVKDEYRRSDSIKKRLIEYKLKKYVCEVNGCLPFWNGKQLNLQIDHINGDRFDNRLANLRFICPNCHSQTLTFSKGNKEIKKNMATKFDIDYFKQNRDIPSKEEISKILGMNGINNAIKNFKMSHHTFKALCNFYEIDLSSFLNREKILWESNIKLQKLVLEKPLLVLGKELGVSDNAVRKRVQANGLFLPTSITQTYWMKLKHNKINKVTFEDLILENDKYILSSSYKMSDV